MRLTATDGHQLEAYQVGDGPRGLIVIQEIFGLNGHIRDVCDEYASHGFRVISPALFDRIEGGVELGYGPEDLKRGSELAGRVGLFEAPMLDVGACLDYFPGDMPVGVVGYCWGGTLAWLSAQQLPRLKACVGYYGGRIGQLLQKPPLAPVMLHFAAYDKHIPIEDTRAIAQAYPQVQVFEYQAGHGFNCAQRDDYHAEAAKLARDRSLGFFDQFLVQAHATASHHRRNAQAQ